MSRVCCRRWKIDDAFFRADNVPIVSDLRARYARIKHHHLAAVSSARACIVAPSHLGGVIDNARCMQHPL